MSWSFVGSVTPVAGTTNFVSSTTTATVSLPAGVQGGDLVIVGMCYAPTTAPGSVSIPGFTSREAFAGGAKSGNFGDFAAVLFKAAGGSTGSATTDTNYTATFTSASFGEFVTYVLRPSLGGFAIVSSAHYNGNSAASYLTTCPDPTYTPSSASNATIWGYAGQNSTVGTTATSFSGTGVTALSNFAQGGLTANGGGIGIGWLQSVSAPGGATASQAVDATDFVLEFAEVTPASPPPIQPQPGGKAWRSRYRRVQQLSQAAAASVLSVNAGLATASGLALDSSNSGGLGIGITTGLATGAGAALAPGIGITAGLATATGAALAPATGSRTIGLATGTGAAGGISVQVIAGLASGTGAANAPNLGLTPGLATAAGTAPGISQAVNAGLATAAGTALAPAVGLTPALATAAGAAFAPAVPRTTVLATGTGASFSPAVGLTPGLATGTGTAGGISQAVNAGLATGTGTAFNITVQAPGISAGLATATGTAFAPVVPRTAGLATGTGTAFAPGPGITAGLASGTGAAFAPSAPRTTGLATGAGTAGGISQAANAGLATGAGVAIAPAVGLTPRLATGTGTASGISQVVNAGLATGTGTAFSPSAPRTAGLATAAGNSLAPVLDLGVRHNVDYTGSTLVNPNTLGGTVAVAALGGTLSVAANTLTGTAAVAANTLGGTASVATLGGTLAVTSDTLTGTLSVVVNPLSGTAVEDKMQEVDIILNEFNDATVTFQILNNASPMNITGMTVNALFKKTRGDLDSAGTTTHYSSGGGSPVITIVTPATGSCTLAIPDADVIFPNWTFYRIDVVNGTVTTTAIFGTVTITQL